ncbi:DUF1801 domain-containing protein [Dactylosporangium sp. NPDC000521]|uniref:DUF1801 domain-containing protein n=1 Tax=Dactylosporangium sp. NPDC000521 TaxID=3363975 RepID=UPI0036D030FE
MADTNQTVAGDGDVGEFVEGVADERRRGEARQLVALMAEVTGAPAVLWGRAIIGFGSRHYRYESGREGDIAAVSFSPRKAQTVLYLTGGVDAYQDLLDRLGPHTTGKGCLYIKRVDAVDDAVLREIVGRSFRMTL